jgi:purine nucleosidase
VSDAAAGTAPRKVLLDCDPGIDDALAIAFACGHPGLDLCAVTTVGGNVPLARTTVNALSVLELAGRRDVPVAAGSPGPLLQPLVDARAVHGESGLGHARLPPPAAQPVAAHAIDLLIETVAAAPGEVTVVATGPLTNIALAVRRHPPLASQVADFVIMGGSAGRGNVTPAAEFNIATDPEAAAIVFAAGWRVTMTGLDVTLQARADEGIRERMRGLGRLGSDLFLPGLGGYRSDETAASGGTASGGTAGDPDASASGASSAASSGAAGGLAASASAASGAASSGAAGGLAASASAAGGGASSVLAGGGAGRSPAVHDVCAVALVAEPGLFGCLPARVEVETVGRWTTGMTVTDFRAPPEQCNAWVAMSLDVPAFWDTAFAAWSRLPAAQHPR